VTEDLRYPLAWPAGRPRTLPHDRRRAAFGRETAHALTLERARKQLERELGLLGVLEFVLSTNIELRLDGAPRSGRPEPKDPGVAVYFDLGKRPTVLACDKWDRIPDNLRAIVKHIDAIRGQERWGVGSIEQAFAGYAALPAPGQHARRPWRVVLGWRADEAGITRENVDAVYRQLARIHHPDNGGDRAAWDELQTAKADALEEFSI
jgi:hypothetical protein